MKKQGFTLVEMIIVMGIIAILSVFAVNGYTSYRKSALLGLSVDSFKSQVDELRSKAVYGDFGEGTAKCFGFYFEDGKAKVFEQEFSDQKVWSSLAETFVMAGCNGDKEIKNDFELDENIKIVEVDPPNFAVRFSPPNGESEVSYDNGFSFKLEGSSLKVTLQYGTSDQRELVINFN